MAQEAVAGIFIVGDFKGFQHAADGANDPARLLIFNHASSPERCYGFSS